MGRQPHLLVFRFSSLGDVAMTVPVIRLLLAQHPGLRITFVSTAFVQPLFEGIDRLQFVAADLKGRHKGMAGLWRLTKELTAAHHFTGLADLHNVLRTKIIRAFLRFSAFPKAAIDKGRREKKELTRPQHKQLRPLRSTFQRYADVFAALGFPVDLQQPYAFAAANTPGDIRAEQANGRRRIGIAPFAQFEEKIYPPGKMEELIRLLSADAQATLYLFGGRAEAAQLEKWASVYPRVRNLAGQMPFRAELDYIGSMEVMVSMDSANMHLASLYGVPVVSVWGGTHPYLGFYGWRQDPARAVQIELSCRPSSVFGNKPCPNSKACLHGIAPLQILQKVYEALDPVKS